MHTVTCDKCKKQCEVPFKPTGNKPVFCSDCFRKTNNSSSNSRNNNTRSQAGISSEQFEQINVKLDKIISFLDKVEFESALEDEDADEENSDEEDDSDSNN